MKVSVKYFDPDLHTQFYQAALSEATLRVPEKNKSRTRKGCQQSP